MGREGAAGNGGRGLDWGGGGVGSGGIRREGSSAAGVGLRGAPRRLWCQAPGAQVSPAGSACWPHSPPHRLPCWQVALGERAIFFRVDSIDRDNKRIRWGGAGRVARARAAAAGRLAGGRRASAAPAEGRRRGRCVLPTRGLCTHLVPPAACPLQGAGRALQSVLAERAGDAAEEQHSPGGWVGARGTPDAGAAGCRPGAPHLNHRCCCSPACTPTPPCLPPSYCRWPPVPTCTAAWTGWHLP